MGICSCCNATQPEDNNRGDVYNVDKTTRETDDCVNTGAEAALEDVAAGSPGGLTGAVTDDYVGTGAEAALEDVAAGSPGGLTGAVTDDCVNTVMGAAIEGAVAGSSGGFTGAFTGAAIRGTFALFTWIKDRPS